jgi:protein-tyrosine-phosphatase
MAPRGGRRAHLMEINPRLWGSLPLTIAAGVDMPRGLLALARGERLPPHVPWRVGLTARNLTDDLQWFIDNLRADRKDPLLLTESPWRTAFGWLRALTGREAWDGWNVRDLAIARHELAALARDRMKAVAQRIEKRAALARARKRHAAMVRDGALSRPVSSVLFICLGNICRSPFAAAVAFDRLPGIAIDSAGFLKHDGRPSPPHIVTAAKSLGVDVSSVRAQRVTAGQIVAANLIVCMDLAHLEMIEREFPEALPKATLLGLFAAEGPAEIRDPYDMSPSATRAVLVQMLRAIDAFAGVQARLAMTEAKCHNLRRLPYDRCGKLMSEKMASMNTSASQRCRELDAVRGIAAVMSCCSITRFDMPACSGTMAHHSA